MSRWLVDYYPRRDQAITAGAAGYPRPGRRTARCCSKTSTTFMSVPAAPTAGLSSVSVRMVAERAGDVVGLICVAYAVVMCRVDAGDSRHRRVLCHLPADNRTGLDPHQVRPGLVGSTESGVWIPVPGENRGRLRRVCQAGRFRPQTVRPTTRRRRWCDGMNSGAPLPAGEYRRRGSLRGRRAYDALLARFEQEVGPDGRLLRVVVPYSRASSTIVFPMSMPTRRSHQQTAAVTPTPQTTTDPGE